MMDRVSNVVVGLDGQGGSGVFAGYAQWERWAAERSRPAPKEAAAPRRNAAPDRKRLSYSESREWESMEERILEAEQSVLAAQAAVQDAGARRDPRRLVEASQALEESQAEVDRLYARWAELEARRQ
jgi:ATP-binding cassette subfamily F protein uup